MQNNVSVCILEMEKFRLNDINRECPFIPEPESIYLHIQALAEDIRNIDRVIDVTAIIDENKITLEINTFLMEEELRNEMKVYLSDHICYLRFANLFTKEIFGATI
jgi:hypothetical protein